MIFNSLDFLIFFPIVLVFYYLVPKKYQYIWLLICSYYFYMCWNFKYALLIFFSTFATYLSALIFDKINSYIYMDMNKKGRLKKFCVALCFVVNLAILGFFKYSNFFIDNLVEVFSALNIELNLPTIDVLLPVGISFYTFQALSYTIDVYRGEIYAEHNFLRYALFVSYFPQLVAGPIERSKNLLKQLAVSHDFCFENFIEGILLMLYGFFQKIVIADRIAIFVDTIYNNISSYSGWYFIVATILFAIQIYCDFGGYSIIAMGASKILGIDLMDNFNVPYLSKSVSEFWRRWHISLSSWFKDYLYIPLGGNRKGTFRKYINLLIVFLVSGLWHGANWSFVIWGGLNGLWQVIGSITITARNKIKSLIHLNDNNLSIKIIKTIITFILIDFTWIFFRANRFLDAVYIIKSICTISNPWIILDGSLYACGLDQKNFALLNVAILILFVADLMKYKGVSIRKEILKQDYLFITALVSFSIVFILIFGIWGGSYDASNFIYFQF